MERLMCDCCLSSAKAVGSSRRCCQALVRLFLLRAQVARSVCADNDVFTQITQNGPHRKRKKKSKTQVYSFFSFLSKTLKTHFACKYAKCLGIFWTAIHIYRTTQKLCGFTVASLHTQALCRKMDVSAGARWWHSFLCTKLPDAHTPCFDCWYGWPHSNDLNHLRSSATHFKGLTEFIRVDRDQCPQPWMLPDYSRGRDLSDWYDWIQHSALILLLIPLLWLGPWGQMSGMERRR